MNYDAIDTGAAEVQAGRGACRGDQHDRDAAAGARRMRPSLSKRCWARSLPGAATEIPVSKLPADGTYPTATTQFEKRNIATEIPVWEPDACIQCAQCSLVCPHAAIRVKLYDPAELEDAPATFKSVDARGRAVQGHEVDRSGCAGGLHRLWRVCVHLPGPQARCGGQRDRGARDQHGAADPAARARGREFRVLPGLARDRSGAVRRNTVKGSQLIRPLFEFSGACAGCGETPYVKLMSQLFGDRAIIANATGCSSIYGGNMPTTPYATREDGRGPTWNNSLFEDAAELGMGMRLTADKLNEYALELVDKLYACECEHCQKNHALFDEIKNADQSTQEGIELQRGRVAALKDVLERVRRARAVALGGRLPGQKVGLDPRRRWLGL